MLVYELVGMATLPSLEGMSLCWKGHLGRFCVPGSFGWLARDLACMSCGCNCFRALRVWLEGWAVSRAQSEKCLSRYRNWYLWCSPWCRHSLQKAPPPQSLAGHPQGSSSPACPAEMDSDWLHTHSAISGQCMAPQKYLLLKTLPPNPGLWDSITMGSQNHWFWNSHIHRDWVAPVG